MVATSMLLISEIGKAMLQRFTSFKSIAVVRLRGRERDAA
jgi:hypothetical protein